MEPLATSPLQALRWQITEITINFVQNYIWPTIVYHQLEMVTHYNQLPFSTAVHCQVLTRYVSTYVITYYIPSGKFSLVIRYAAISKQNAFYIPLTFYRSSISFSCCLTPRSVCHRILDGIPDPDGQDWRLDGPPRHPLPPPRQHLQHCCHQHTQGLQK